MEIILLRQAKKFLDKCNVVLQKRIFQELENISKNPFLGKRLKNKSVKAFSHKFTFQRVSYRITYKFEGNRIIIVIAIGSRENFYKSFYL